MSGGAGGAFGGSRGLRPVPPEKGVFPLDHFGECKKVKEAYLQCLKGSAGKSEKCREVVKEYLQCRMERNLMAKQDLGELGFSEANQESSSANPKGDTLPEVKPERKEAAGFVAGIRKKKQ